MVPVLDCKSEQGVFDETLLLNSIVDLLALQFCFLIDSLAQPLQLSCLQARLHL